MTDPASTPEQVTNLEYCIHCQKITPFFARRGCGATYFHCCECGRVGDQVYDDEIEGKPNAN